MGYRRLELDGKVAVVIGGSSGIGRTLARGFRTRTQARAWIARQRTQGLSGS